MDFRNASTRGPLMVMAAFAALFAGTETALAGSFRESLSPLALEIKQVIFDDQKQTAIQIGEFSGNGHPNCGPGLCEDLKLALNALQPGMCQDQAPLKLKGEYDQIQDPRASHLIILQVSITIRDVNGRKVSEKSIEVRDTGLIASAMGATVYLPPKANRDDRNERLKKAIAQPSYHAENTIIRSRPDSPFGVEVLVAPLSAAPHNIAGWSRIAARPPVNQNGEAFVPIKQNEVYALRIHNRLKREVAVIAALDGVDAFTFSEIRDQKGLPRFKHFIFAPGTGIIPGWHKTNQYSDSFLVTEYGKGAASKVGLPAKGNIGVITLRFALAWEGSKVPEEEYGSRDGGKETGFGPPVKMNQKEVQRHVGVDRDVIAIRYSR